MIDTTTVITTQFKKRPAFGTYQEAAERLGCTTATIRNYVVAGKLTGYRMGPRMRRIDLDEVEALIKVVKP